MPDKLQKNTNQKSILKMSIRQFSNGPDDDRANNFKHYTEEQRLRDVFTVNSTLEEPPLIDGFDEGEQTYLDAEDFQRSDSSMHIHEGGLQSESQNSSKMFRYLKKLFITNNFMANHIILNNCAVTPAIFHLMLFIEFIQMLFFAFLNVNITNEFAHNTNSMGIQGNQTNVGNASTPIGSGSSYQFKISDLIMNAKLPIFWLELRTQTSFISVYAILSLTFYFLLIMIYLTSKRLFKSTRFEEPHDMSLIYLQCLSIIMGLYVFLFQIPMVGINVYAYMCDNSGSSIYTLIGQQCGSIYNEILVVLSTVNLVIYLSFLFVQHTLFIVCNFNKNIPWASLGRELAYVKVLWKLIIAIAIVLDSSGTNNSIISLGCSVIGCFIVYKRLTVSIIFNKSIYYATAVYEIMITWLFLCIPLHNISNTEISISTLLLITFSGVFLIVILLHISSKQAEDELRKMTMRDDASIAQSSPSSQLLIFKMLTLVESEEPTDVIMLRGMIENHLDYCSSIQCGCRDIVNDFQSKYHWLLLTIDKEDEDHHEISNQEIDLTQARQKTTVMESPAQIQEQRQPLQIKQSTIRLPPLQMKQRTIRPLIPITINSEDDVTRVNRSLQVQKTRDRQDSFMRDNSMTEEDSPNRNRQNQDEPPPQRLSLFQQLSHHKKDTLSLNLPLSQQSLRSTKSNAASPQGVDPKSAFLAIMKAAFSKKVTGTQSRVDVNEINSELQSQRSVLSRQQSMASNSSLESAMPEQNVEVVPEKILDEQELKKDQRFMNFRFLALFIEKMIKKFPMSAILRIHNSFIQSTRLSNEFKANFEMMKGELCNPSLQTKFFIFRRRIDLHKLLVKKNASTNISSEKVDPQKMYTYSVLSLSPHFSIYHFEKLNQRFQLLKYLAANSALSFWRELLQKDIDSQVLLDRGAKITKSYELINELASEIIKIYPEEIKFHVEYAIFLKQVVNNDIEAMANYNKASDIYQNMLVGTGNRTDHVQEAKKNEYEIFGNNNAVALVMIALRTEDVGIILHANDEITRVLGYDRKNLIGKKVNTIQPFPIAIAHDRFLRRFLESAQRNIVEHVLQLFAHTSNGYLKPIHIIVKLYPRMSDQIIAVGFIQSLPKILGMEPIKISSEGTLSVLTQLDMQTHHYILTDMNGNISSISEELANLVGLNSKMFVMHDENIQKVSIEKLFQENLSRPDKVDQLITTGLETFLDTRNIIQHVSLDKLTSEEVKTCKAKLRKIKVQIQMKRLIFDEKFCTVDLYRIIILRKGSNVSNFAMTMMGGSRSRGTHRDDFLNDSDTSGSNGHASQSVSSTASAASRMAQGSKAIQDFKSAISKRETPRQLTVLNRLIIVILLLTMIVSSVDYFIKTQFVNTQSLVTDQLVQNESRTIKLIQLISNIRSFLNIANGIEIGEYDDPSLQRVDRITYLQFLIQSEANLLQEVQDYITQQRVSQQSQQQSTFEYQEIGLYQISSQAQSAQFDFPFRLAINTYLNNILLLNVTDPQQASLPDSILTGNPSGSNLTPTHLQQDLYYILVNGLRSILITTMNAEENFKILADQFTSSSYMVTFIVIMVVGLLVSSASLGLILYKIVETERNKEEIMSIFALFSPNEINNVYDICDYYIDHFEKAEDSEDEEQEVNRHLHTDYTKGGFGQSVFPPEEFKDSDDMSSDSSNETRAFNQMDHHYFPLKSITPREYYSKLLRFAISIVKDEGFIDQVNHRKAQRQHRQNKQNAFNASMKQSVKHSSASGFRTMKSQKKIVINAKEKKILKQFDISKPFKDESKESDHDSSSHSLTASNKSDPQPKFVAIVEKAKVVKEEQKEEDGISSTEFGQRKQMITQSSSKRMNNCWNLMIINILTALIFYGFYIYTFVYHNNQLSLLSQIQQESPIFFRRYSDLFLSYNFIRERIINNNTNLSSLQYYYPSNIQPLQGVDIDEYYYDQSIIDQNSIEKLQLQNQQSISPLLNFFDQVDSEQFCASVFSQTISYGMGPPQQSNLLLYQMVMINTIASLKAAQSGDILTIEQIYSNNIDLNKGDYDFRTPLHVACTAGQTNMVQKLLSYGVNVNSTDRWGSTPLNDAYQNPQIVQILISRGAILGKPKPLSFYQPLQIALSQNQLQLLYAAYHQDIGQINILISSGQNINGQDANGRTGLAVASSSNNLNTVKFLIQNGANMTIVDQLGNDAMDDAIRSKGSATIFYLTNEVLLPSLCESYQSGIFSKGIAQMTGTFVQKFQSLLISTHSGSQTLSYLGGTRYPTNQSSIISIQNVMQILFQTQELYLNKVIDLQISVLSTTYTNFSASYSKMAQIVFFSFIAFQLLTLTYLRKKFLQAMKDDVMRSRGILNLVPISFFKDHQQEVANVINLMKT